MTSAECLHILGLTESASIDDIRRAYHRLALRSHPDRNSGDDAARRRFISVVNAYRTLMRHIRTLQTGNQIGQCSSCRQFGEILRGMDGSLRCPRCALNMPSRLLPMPAPIVVRCGFSLLCILAATVCLISAAPGKQFAHGLIALLLGVCGLASLAYTCLRIQHCMPPKTRAIRRRWPADRAISARRCAKYSAQSV